MLNLIISAAILFILFYKIGAKNVYDSFIKINLLCIIPIFFLIFFMFFINTINLKFLINKLGHKIKFFRLFSYHVTSWSLDLLLPAKLGEFSILYFLKKEKIPYQHSFLMFIFDKLGSVLAALIIFMIGYFIYLKNEIFLLYFFITIFLILLFFIFFLNKKIQKFIKKLFFKIYKKNLNLIF